jgi:uncharacterized protein (DUF2147 family)
MTFVRSVMAAALAAGLGGQAAGAQEMTPVGVWEAVNGLSRYTVSYCGEGGDELCAYVSWIHPDVIVKRDNARFLNRTVFDHLKRVGDWRWHGTVNFQGYEVEGSVELLEPNVLRVTGCVFLVLCQTGDLPRVDEGS